MAIPLNVNPMALFRSRLEEAAAREPSDPAAACLATASRGGAPSARMVQIMPAHRFASLNRPVGPAGMLDPRLGLRHTAPGCTPPAPEVPAMPVLAFDTLKATRALTAAGMAEPVAEAVVETMNDAVTEGVATKADIAKLESGIAEVKADTARLEAGIAELKTEVRADTARLEAGIAGLRTEVRADIDKLEAGIAELKTEVRADIDKLEADIAGLKTEVRADVARLESGIAEVKADTARLEAGIAGLKTEVRADIDKLESRLMAKMDTDNDALRSRQNTHQWMFGFIAAMLFLIIGRLFGAY